MKNYNDLIQGVVIIVIGMIIILSWKKFSIEIAKYSIRYSKNIELGVRVCLYIIGLAGIIGGFVLLYKFFRN